MQFDQRPIAYTYAPQPVPLRDATHPSIRDDVRATLRRHNFRPSATHFTDVTDIYKLFLSDTAQTANDSPELQEKFRSALGRVLRPPSNAGAYALSYAVPDLRRFNKLLSIVSPDTRQINPVVEVHELKQKHGDWFRENAKTSAKIARLRQDRKEKAIREAANPVGDLPPQQLSFRYIDEFLALNCAEDLVRLKVFPNGKELAESMSAYAAVRHYLHKHQDDHEESDGILSFRDPNVLLLAVGDGCTPRTASLFAYRSAWRCVSLDPVMRTSGAWDEVTNLQTIKAKVQDVTVPVSSSLECYERVVVIMWHCHVPISDALACLEFEGQRWDVEDRAMSRELRKRVALVTCACCNFDQVQKTMPDGSRPDEEYEDTSVPGLMRTVRVWKFTK